MGKLRILTIPTDEINLRKRSKEVTEITPEAKAVIADLIDTLKSSERPGVGLAAPQIGHNLRIVIIESEGYERDKGEIVDRIPRKILINPKITKFSKEKVVIEEGCLSVPTIMGNVKRPKKVKVEAQDEKGKKICINASGFLARVLQHEIDHLDGILFIDLIEDKKSIREI